DISDELLDSILVSGRAQAIVNCARDSINEFFVRHCSEEDLATKKHKKHKGISESNFVPFVPLRGYPKVGRYRVPARAPLHAAPLISCQSDRLDRRCRRRRLRSTCPDFQWPCAPPCHTRT